MIYRIETTYADDPEAGWSTQGTYELMPVWFQRLVAEGTAVSATIYMELKRIIITTAE